jgi:DNA uptake protein ComE-like DNA-binding protein
MKSEHRGLALVAVLVVMGGALLVATSLLFVVHAEMAGCSVAAERAQTQALMRSGIAVVVMQLNEQREEILAGRTPQIDQEFVIYETGLRTGVVRLLGVGPGGERLVPEAGKLDLQAADTLALAATGLVDETLAQEIIDYQAQSLGRPYQSVAELLRVPGMSSETLYGPIEEFADPPAPPPGNSTPDETAARGLGDVVTVYGVEPALQQDGTLRINLNTPWSDELAARITDRFDSGVAETIQGIMEDTTFDSDSKIFEVLNFFEMPPEDWPEVVDTFTTDDGDLHFGRLDINTASHEALLSLPGLEPEQATQIVQARENLPDDQRATIAWPAIQGIVESDAYEQFGGLITTRSWTYRLRLAAGEVDADDPDAPLVGAMVYEIVVDLSAPRPRLAYLREMSWLRITALIAANTQVTDNSDTPDTPETPDPEMQPQDADAVPTDEAIDDPAPPEARRLRRIGRWTAG